MYSLKNEDLRSENEKNRHKGKFWTRPFFRQLLILISPVAINFSSGLAFGTATVMVPQIKANNSGIHLDAEIESWLYSITGFAAIPSVLTAPYLSHVKGYKFAFKITCLPVIVGYIIQYLATTDVQLLVAAILQSLTIGGNCSIVMIIVSEYSEPKYRGTFLIFKSASFFWGIWVSNAIGTFTSWRNIPLVGILPAICALALCFIWPESPYWLANKGKFEECRKSFRWLRGEDETAEKELKLLTRPKAIAPRQRNVFCFLKTTLLLRQFYMPLFLNLVIFFVYQSCGKYVCHMYVLVIIKDITKNNAEAYSGMLIMDGINVLGMYVGSYVVMKIRRRVMFFFTIISTIACLYVFSLYLYLAECHILTSNNNVSLCILLLYSFSVSWGPAILCPSFFSEITPMRFKPFISAVSVTSMLILQSIFLKLAPLIFKTVGVNGTFAVYATLTSIAVLFLWKYLPETSNKTLKEIEMSFVRNNLASDSFRDSGEEEDNMLR